jgi:hypothetical protein
MEKMGTPDEEGELLEIPDRQPPATKLTSPPLYLQARRLNPFPLFPFLNL